MINKMRCCSFIAAFVIVLSGWIGGWTRAMKAGNAAYVRGNYNEAHAAFQRATLEKPDNPVAHYNLGTALYRQGKFREAARTFQASLSRHAEQTEDTLNRSSILYNLGNAQFKVGDLTSAIDAYQQALRFDPQDTDAHHNLALARQLLKQQQDLAQQQAKSSTAPKTEPNDVGKAEALRLLERFSENENRLRQKLQQQRKSGYRREKDW
ncbi:tetratricopeptide repeat protein [Candidatus Poribacteria bacterium]|nr:tetratricopeptide repeat protein [Candidatus Poribacteria bacterium]MYA55482.1 tetratricopeptide repeat protein [Candidatus Poribacteria bacterium]